MNSATQQNQILFATSGYDHTIRLWHPNNAICYKILQHNESVNCMAFHPNKNLMATGGYQQVCIYDIQSNSQNLLMNLDGVAKNTIAIGFKDKGTCMYTAGENKSIKLWDMRNIKCSSNFDHSMPITSLAIHPNQFEFVFGDDKGSMYRWDIRTDQSEALSMPEKSKSTIRSISINQEGTMMAAVNNEGFCYYWLLSGGQGDNPSIVGRCQINQFHKRYVLKCLFSPDSTLLATSSADGTAKIWRTVDFSLISECKETKPGGSKWIWDLAFTCDSEYLLTASSDNAARLWAVKTGEIKRDFIGHQKPVVCLAFSDT